MIVEHNGEIYKAEFVEDGRIAYYKQINGEWVFIKNEEI